MISRIQDFNWVSTGSKLVRVRFSLQNGCHRKVTIVTSELIQLFLFSIPFLEREIDESNFNSIKLEE